MDFMPYFVMVVVTSFKEAAGLTAPSYISEWTFMEVYNPVYCRVTVSHNFGEFPVLVEVQVRPRSGPNEGWIFKGIGSAQRDFKDGSIVGGVAYVYNQYSVILMVPCSDTNGSSVIINTGPEFYLPLDSPYHSVESSADVRVRAWKEDDLTNPLDDITFTMSITDNTKTYKKLNISSSKLNHCSVQIRATSGSLAGWVCDAQGSSVVPSSSDFWGGVIYKILDGEFVEFWAPSSQAFPAGQGSLCNTLGGWGTSSGAGVGYATVAEIRFRHWYFIGVQQDSDKLNRVYLYNHVHEVPLPNAVNLDDDILSVRATGNYWSADQFESWLPFGAAMVTASDTNSGSVVYAINGTNLRAWWSPAPNFHLGNGWGEGYTAVGSSTTAEFLSVRLTSLTKGCYAIYDEPNSIRTGPDGPMPYAFGTRVSYTCIEGYEKTGGNYNRECKGHGFWSGRSINCTRVICPPPDPGVNSTVVPFSGDYVYEMEAAYTCILDNRIVNGSSVRKCNQNREWTGTPLNCTWIIECPIPPNITHAQYRPAAGPHYAFSSVSYSCEDGYRISGPDVIYCHENGSWDQVSATCIRCMCECNMLGKYAAQVEKQNRPSNKTVEEHVEETKEKLTVIPETTSTFRRKKESARDERTASKSVAYVSLIFLGLLIGAIVIPDLVNLLTYIFKQTDINDMDERLLNFRHHYSEDYTRTTSF